MQSFFTRLWSKIIKLAPPMSHIYPTHSAANVPHSCCKAIMTAMKKLLDCLVNITRQLSSIVKVIYLQLGE